jgi:hypothetical protein
MGEGRNVYRFLMGKPEGKGPLERPRHRWEDGFKMHLREIGLGGAEWIPLDQDGDCRRTLCECGDKPLGSNATDLVS